MLFNGGKLAGNEQMTEDLCYEKKNNPWGVVCQVYWYIKVNVYRAIGPLVNF